MQVWYTTLASLVAQRLTDDPSLTLEKALEDIRRTTLSTGLFLEGKLNELTATLFENRDSVFSFQGVLNPLFLKTAFELKPFFYLINSRGNYKALRALLQDLPQDTSRFILYGPDDVLILIFGSDSDNEIWLDRVTASQFPVEQLLITDTVFFKGYPVQPFNKGFADSNILAHDVNKLVTDYWAEDGDELREKVVAQHILLGPTLVENITATNRVVAFLMIDIRGKIPQDRDSYFKLLMDTPQVKKFIRSVYVCSGRYNLILEVICSNLQELDRLTEDIQTPLEHRYSVESVTHVVALVEKDELPIIPLKSVDSQEADRELSAESVSLFQPLTNRILEKHGLKVIADFKQLPIDKQLFLVQLFYELAEFDSNQLSPELGSEWEEAIDSLIRGYAANSAPAVKSAVGAVARIVEGISKEALIKLLDIFYEANYGEAQRQLRLPNTNVGNFTLGVIADTFNALQKRGILTALSLDTDDLQRSYSIFSPTRNELVHDPTPPRYKEDFTTFMREVRQALNHAVFIINWLSNNILNTNWKNVVVSNAIRFFELINMSDPSPEVHRLGQELQNIVQENPETFRERMERLGVYDNPASEYAVIIYYLCTLLAVQTARKKVTQDYHNKLYKLAQFENLLTYIKEERISSVERLLTGLNDTYQALDMNVTAILIWYVLLSVESEYFLDVFSSLVT